MKQEVVEIENNTNPFLNKEEPKSKGVIGNIEIHFDKKFSWLQRKMWKICFGVDITNLE